MAEANEFVAADQAPKKRLRKGTTSCQDCKRRKIRCFPNPNNSAVCFGCQSRGVPCISQGVRADDVSQSDDNRAQIQQRLSRVESFLETLAQTTSLQEPHVPPVPVNTTIPLVRTDVNVSQPKPMSSLVDDPVLCSMNSTHRSRERGTPLVETSQIGRLSKEDNLYQTLSEMLPSQHDTDIISAASNAWALVDIFQVPNGGFMPGSVMDAIPDRRPTIVARRILRLAICMQQLPPDFDATQLFLGYDIDALIERYTTTVRDIVTSHDELVGTTEGLECLFLLGVFHIMAGNLRQAWVSFRRALNISQLMSLHKDMGRLAGSRNLNTSCEGKYLYRQIVHLDRYLCAILGMPCGSDAAGIDSEESSESPEANTYDIFRSKLSTIAVSIIRRNEVEAIQTLTSTHTIIDQIDKLLAQLPTAWWQIPSLSSVERSAAAPALFSRLIIQIAFFQLESLLHLPFLLRNEQRYEYNRRSCLKACREVILRFLALRRASINFCCRMVDFGAFTSALILVIAFASLNNEMSLHAFQEQHNDRALVQQFVDCMTKLARSNREKPIAAQSVDVLKTLLADKGTFASNIRFLIPYFGIITIVSRSNILNKTADAISCSKQVGTNSNVIIFTSSQFPSLGDVPLIDIPEQTDFISYHFDSLLISDLDGNW